ncbi:MAG: hypothetical protein QG566_617 [Patescibacteria group bacterium]|jgi:hypothetical protein|nr:hypothetical protein [Patescibacteria group bacterium]
MVKANKFLSCLFLSNKIFPYGTGKKICTLIMISVNKLGKLALSRLAKKLNAFVEYPEGEIPFAKFYKHSSSSFHPASSSVSYAVYLWDWEYGLTKILTLDEFPLGLAIKSALTEEETEWRTETCSASHIAIYTYSCSDDGQGMEYEHRDLAVYRFNLDKLNEWLEICQMDDKQYYARPEHHRD